MFRLVRLLMSCLLLGGVIWFATTVPLGKWTLWGHLVRIARTPEARELASGARDTAREVARRVKQELDATPSNGPAPSRPHP
ncbi:MAG: hypothetical protein RMK29_03005 [Myxococcales bacterium]|nr:hypothetical protein [Myxococcota bacterium]MDW8280652.1 hypothetical protein [Myxococcales bacterium]